LGVNHPGKEEGGGDGWMVQKEERMKERNDERKKENDEQTDIHAG
jgi:hypothetical protein